MASFASGDVEIMVHTTARCRGQDDARYRALARAYTAFEPAKRQKLREQSASREAEDYDQWAHIQLQGELLQSTQEERESAASYRPNEENDASTGAKNSLHSEALDRVDLSCSLESPILSFNSVFDNVDSPVFRGLVTRCDEVSELVRNYRSQQSSDSWRPPPSVIADSQPETDRALTAFSSPTRVLELYRQRLDTAKERLPQSGRQEQEDEGIGTGSVSDTRELFPNSSLESSRIMSSPSPSKHPSMDAEPIPGSGSYGASSPQGPGLNMKRKWPESSSGKIHTCSALARATNSSSPCSEQEDTCEQKRQRTEISTGQNLNVASIIPSSNVVTTPTPSPTNNETPPIWSDFLEIRPSPPTTSSDDLTAEMFITNTLQQLASKMPAARLFRPAEQIRDLRPMERGHWLLNCQGWTERLRSRCWNCLGNYIGKDLVGWGVWCVRDAEHSTIRVYCWGIIVGHIYLLLYMASERKIMGTGACWIGGDGKAIIKMSS